MTKADLVEKVAEKTGLTRTDVAVVVDSFLETVKKSLEGGHNIEIRGFGSFSLHFRAPRKGRNPKTGDTVQLAGKYVPHFKPGKEMRERVNDSLHHESAAVAPFDASNDAGSSSGFSTGE